MSGEVIQPGRGAAGMSAGEPVKAGHKRWPQCGAVLRIRVTGACGADSLGARAGRGGEGLSLDGFGRRFFAKARALAGSDLPLCLTDLVSSLLG